MSYIDVEVLDMARAQANATLGGIELPYKPPYKYKTQDGEERVSDKEWFESYVKSLVDRAEQNEQSINELPKTN